MKQKLIPKKNYLESEKEDIIKIFGSFIDAINLDEFQEFQINGRPKADLKDTIKCLLVMNYHSWSYQRSYSDLEILRQRDFIKYIPRKSTLNKYMNEEFLEKILERLIAVSAQMFIDTEECFMMDSTWFFNKIIYGGTRHKKNIMNQSSGRPGSKVFCVPSHYKTRKLHIIIGRNSKIITSAGTSIGSKHDHNFFVPLIKSTISSGFRIKTLLADSAYNSKENYLLCEDNGIKAFLDFKKNHVVSRSKSFLRKQQLILYKEKNEVWHETYRFRVVVESTMSKLKRISRHFLRGKNSVSQNNEMLLKCLNYNFGIIARFMDSL